MKIAECEYYSDKFKQILSDYKQTLRAERTFVEYTRITALICNFLKKDFLDIDESDAEKYFNTIKASIRTGEVTRKTVGMRLSCCNSISKFIEKQYEEIVYDNPFKGISRPETNACISPTSIPSIEELDAIMTQAKKEGDAVFLIMALATRMSLSSTAIVKLTKNDILEENGLHYLKTEPVSTKPANLIMVPSDVDTILTHYISLMETDSEGHLFFNKYNNPLTIRNLDTITKRVVKASGVTTQYTIKDLRKRGVLELAKTIKNNNDKAKVAEYVGIKANRLNDYINAASYISNSCPPNLTNYRLKTSEDT